MKGRHILLWALVDLTTFKLGLPSRITRLYFLSTCWTGWSLEFRLPLLTLLQLQSYLVPCTSARRFITLKLQDIYCELFPFCIEHLPHCYSARKRSSYRSVWEHLSRALPTEMIFDQLRAIPSDLLLHGYTTELKLDTLEIIVKWLQVSVSESNRQTPQT